LRGKTWRRCLDILSNLRKKNKIDLIFQIFTSCIF
jgi:hypothetical protein